MDLIDYVMDRLDSLQEIVEPRSEGEYHVVINDIMDAEADRLSNYDYMTELEEAAIHLRERTFSKHINQLIGGKGAKPRAKRQDEDIL